MMGREIEFRVWETETQQMRMIGPGHKWKLAWRVGPGYEVYRESATMVYNFFVPEMGALMQYTGLKDKNGTKIFDGDIVEYREWDHHRSLIVKDAVFWSEEEAAWMLSERNWLGEYFKDAEVIGNIHQNPELLEAE